MTIRDPKRSLEQLLRAWSVPTLRPQIRREVGFVGQRINRQLSRQSLYRLSLRRGRLQAEVTSSTGYIPDAIRMTADAELERPRGRPLHVIRTRETRANRPGRDLVRIRYVRAGRRGGRRGLAQRKVLAGLYNPALLRLRDSKATAGPLSRDARGRFSARGGANRSGRLAGLGADFLLARRIAHSPALYRHRAERQLRKQVRTLERRMGFLLRRRGL